MLLNWHSWRKHTVGDVVGFTSQELCKLGAWVGYKEARIGCHVEKLVMS
jgi:hypothetical protein